jgi:hypothetical protein
MNVKGRVKSACEKSRIECKWKVKSTKSYGPRIEAFVYNCVELKRAVHKLFISQQNYTNLDIELEEPEVGNGDKKNLCVEWPFHLLSCSPHNEMIWNER